MPTQDIVFGLSVFLLAGTVKGLVGLGLPTITIALTSLVLPLSESITLIALPTIFTNVWQAAVGGRVRVILKRPWPLIVPRLAMAAAVLIAAGAVTRSLSLVRNARLRPKSTVQSATGIANPKIVQKAQGAMGGSFNTREFFHGRSIAALRLVKWFFLLAVFVLPLAMILLALEQGRIMPFGEGGQSFECLGDRLFQMPGE